MLLQIPDTPYLVLLGILIFLIVLLWIPMAYFGWKEYLARLVLQFLPQKFFHYNSFMYVLVMHTPWLHGYRCVHKMNCITLCNATACALS